VTTTNGNGAGEERQRLVTWKVPITDQRQITALSGLEYLQHLLDTGRQPPIGALLGFQLVQIAPGSAVFTGTPADYHYNPIGVVHGGFAAAVLDSALGCSIHTTLKAGLAYTTIELKVNYARPLLETTGIVTCRGAVIHAGTRVATAEARLTDTQGKLYAHGSTTCLIFPADRQSR
jgi:uncharacterized protein (TIGR00369 family)